MFYAEDVPIDELREWHLHRRWSGSLVLREGVNYAGY